MQDVRVPSGYEPYFYGTKTSKKSLHKPVVTFGNTFFQISYGFNYYLQLSVYSFYLKLTKIVKHSLLASK
jgi:hypothetical protein